MNLIALTLTIASLTTHPQVVAIGFDWDQRMATYTDTQLHLCLGNVSFTFNGALPVSGSIGADGCKLDRVFANGFEAGANRSWIGNRDY